MGTTRLLGNIVLMTFLKLLGLCLSVVLIMLQTALLGTSPAADAYFFVRRLILSGIAMVFEACNQLTVPEFVRSIQGGAGDVRGALWRFGLPLVGSMGLLALFLALAADPIVRLMAPGFDDGRVSDAATLLRISALCLPLAMMGAMAGAFNFARRRFGLTMLARLAPRLALIPVFVILGAAVTPVHLTWALVAGVAVMTALIMWKGYAGLRAARATGALPPRRSHTRARAAAVTLNAAAQMGMGWIDAALASLTGLGGVTIMFVAQRLLSAAPGAVTSSVTSAYYTEYSHEASQAGARPKPQIAQAVRLSLFLTLPLATFAMVTATPLIEVLLQRGAFDAADTAATAELVRVLAGLLILNAVLAALMPAVLADDSLPLVRIICTFAAAALAIRVVVGLPLAHLFGLKGVAVSIICASAGSAAVLAHFLYRKHGPLMDRADLAETATMILAAVAAGSAAHIALSLIAPGGPAAVVLGAGIVGLVFLGATAQARLPEMMQIAALLRRRKPA